MPDLDHSIVERLRQMAHQGGSPSAMLRYLYGCNPIDVSPKVTVIRYMREAFAMSLQQASPIAGWSDDGTGLADGELNTFIQEEIDRNRPRWDAHAPVPV